MDRAAEVRHLGLTRIQAERARKGVGHEHGVDQALTRVKIEAERAASGQPTPQFGLVPTENAPRPDAALAAAINDVLGLPTEE